MARACREADQVIRELHGTTQFLAPAGILTLFLQCSKSAAVSRVEACYQGMVVVCGRGVQRSDADCSIFSVPPG